MVIQADGEIAGGGVNSLRFDPLKFHIEKVGKVGFCIVWFFSGKNCRDFGDEVRGLMELHLFGICRSEDLQGLLRICFIRPSAKEPLDRHAGICHQNHGLPSSRAARI